MGIWALYKLTAVVLIASQAVQGAGVCGTALQCPSGIEGALGFDVRALRRSLDSCSNCFENWVKLIKTDLIQNIVKATEHQNAI